MASVSKSPELCASWAYFGHSAAWHAGPVVFQTNRFPSRVACTRSQPVDQRPICGGRLDAFASGDQKRVELSSGFRKRFSCEAKYSRGGDIIA